MQENKETGLKIVCIGVGGAGGNVVQSMFGKISKDIDLIVLNTDIEILGYITKVKTMQIGSKLLQGSDTGNNPKLGEEAAVENQDEIRNVLKDADIVFIIAGLGGGTGTGATPVVAQIAKEIGALTISIVTIPFEFEGKARLKIAKEGLQRVQQESNSVILFNNDTILSLTDNKLSIKDSFKFLDDSIREAVNGIAGIVVSNGDYDINLDFADLKVVMDDKKMASIGIGKYEGENSATEAMQQALQYKFLENIPLDKVTGVLIHFNVHPDFPIMELFEAVEIVNQGVNDDADIIFGTTTDNSLSQEYVKVSLLLSA